ncbi:MAG: hypothetical protein BGN92_00540 [Sphingobacteriales bacterium 41-5]|nr:MAG: hypothetical protein BGN92_00540 [Sphingobacteriales bacterium 41-5]
MKKLHILIFIVVLAMVPGCKKFLDKQPNDVINRQGFYKSIRDFDLAIQGVYNTLQAVHSGTGAAQYGWSADEGFGARSTFVVPGTYNLNSSSSYYNSVWSALYGGIKEANILVDAMDKNPDVFTDSTSKKRGAIIKGEAMFLRGYYYFILVQLYGGVPLRLSVIESVNNMELPRSSIKEVYNQVLADMRPAEELVPDITTLGYGGRLNKSAVRGILARVNITMAGRPLMETNRYDSARYWAGKVINDGVAGHDLSPDLPELFRKFAADEYDIKESIWEVEFAGDNLNPSLYNETGNVACFNGPASNNAETGLARGYTGITRKNWLIFGTDAGDMRKWFNIAWFNYNATGSNGAKTYKGTSSNNTFWYGYQPGKFRREWERYRPKGGFSATPVNMPILRFADVLLMYAEADNEIYGPTAESIEYVNRIRRRVWSTGIVDAGVRVANQGSGYDPANPPKVTISGGGGNGARAVATVAASGANLGKVTAVAMTFTDSVLFWTRGSGYTTVPTITIDPPPPGGTQATATITGIYNKGQADVPAAARASKDAFRAFIQDERFRELCFEDRRKFDLIRWGIFLDVIQQMAVSVKADYNGATNYITTGYANTTARDTLWPIPLNELTANPVVTQNLGW